MLFYGGAEVTLANISLVDIFHNLPFYYYCLARLLAQLVSYSLASPLRPSLPAEVFLEASSQGQTWLTDQWAALVVYLVSGQIYPSNRLAAYH